MNNKYIFLRNYLKKMKSAVVAFSAGVDSTFLLYTAKEVMGDGVFAVTIRSAFMPETEYLEAEEFCRNHQIRFACCDVNILSRKDVCENPEDRCYLCKNEIFSHIKQLAEKKGIKTILEGSNADDAFDYRPGSRAIKELGIVSPLAEAGLTKAEIRELSRQKGLYTAAKPSMACLASRIPYGTFITREKLDRIEKAENLLKQLGFRQYRVRLEGSSARIEVFPEDFEKILQNETRNLIIRTLKESGFSYISLDLEGFRSGSLNEVLRK